MEPVKLRRVEKYKTWCEDHKWIDITNEEFEKMCDEQDRIVCPVCHKQAALGLNSKEWNL